MKNLTEFKIKLAESDKVKWNPENNFESLYIFNVNANVDQIWNYLSDTSRFNREMGLAPRTQVEKNGKVYVTTTMVGLTQEWIEEPWMWVAGQSIMAERQYIKGLAKRVQIFFYLVPDFEKKTTRVYIYFGWVLTNKFSKLFLLTTAGLIKAKFQKAFNKIETYLSAHQTASGVEAFRKKHTEFNLDQKMRLYSLSDKLMKKGLDKNIVKKLVELLETGDDLELDAIRVMKLAQDWNISYKELLKVCLHGSRFGMLNLSWTVVCPHCRGPRFSTESLGLITTKAECEACDIKFETDEKNVIEVLFKIHPSIRKISNAVYCAAEPAKKNHIKIQQLINAKNKIDLNIPPISGLYCLRVKGKKRAGFYQN